MPDARIRSFHARRGRISASLREALEGALPGISVPVGPPIDPSALFTPPLPLVLEIGCGMGEATLAMARREPHVGILAADVHTRGIAAMARTIEGGGPGNVRLAHGDAVTVLESLPTGSLAGIRLWFPDPWPKARHHKRRLVQPAFAALAASRLEPAGLLHAATDWAEYAEQMRDVLSACPDLRFVSDERPAWRPVTRYERAAHDAGRVPQDLLYRRLP